MNQARADFDRKNIVRESIDLSQKIIDNYRSVTQTVRPDYVAYLTQKSFAYSERAKETANNSERAQAVIEQAMVALVDRLYGLLEAYTQEINRVNGSQQLHLTCVAPSRPSEALELNRQRQASKTTSFYRTRFSTSKFSLVIRGMQNRVEFFLIAADRVMGLSHEESRYEPLMVFEAELEAANGTCELNRTVENKNLTADRFERYSLLALEHLIDKTQEELGGLT